MCKDRKHKRESANKSIKNCLSKIAYKTKHEAEEYAKLLRKKFPNTIQTPYHCNICGLYHLTSQGGISVNKHT